MPKKIVILVHGMGEHTKPSLKKDFITPFNKALSSYPSMASKKVENIVSIVPFAYNSKFKAFRDKVAKNSESVADAISGVGGNASLVTEGIKLVNKLDTRVAKDSFFTTHWLDVIFYYYTLIGESIRLDLAIEINKAVNKVGASDVHIVAHSLGTSLVHDTLEKLYGSSTLPADSKATKLDITTHKLGSVHMIANVGRALQSFSKVRDSAVRPGKSGCISEYFEYRHKLDPIPQVKPFNPTDNQNWVSHGDFEQYKLVEPCSVVEANTHGLSHYIENPMVHLELFRSLILFKPKAAERDAVKKSYLDKTASGKANILQQLADDATLQSPDSINDLLSAAIDMKNFVVGFGGSFQ